MKIILFIFLFFALSCASKGHKYKSIPTRDDKASIYIYRKDKFSGGGMNPDLKVSNQKRTICNGGYVHLYLNEGKQKVRIYYWQPGGVITGTQIIDFKNSKEYFYQYFPNEDASLPIGKILGAALSGIYQVKAGERKVILYPIKKEYAQKDMKTLNICN